MNGQTQENGDESEDELLQSLTAEVTNIKTKEKEETRDGKKLKALVDKTVKDMYSAIDLWMEDSPVRDLSNLQRYLEIKNQNRVQKGVDQDGKPKFLHFNKNAKLQFIYDGTHYPKAIRNLAAVLTNLPVSNAPVERIFSQLKLVYSKRRLRMTPNRVSDILFLGVNQLVPNYSLGHFLAPARMNLIQKAADQKQ